MPTDTIYTTAALAAVLSCSESRVRHMIRDGVLAAERLGYNCHRVTPAALRAAKARPGRGWKKGRPRKTATD